MSELDPRLASDCRIIGRFPLCRLLLMNDANYPWFILVPDREAITEIYQLSSEDQQQLMRESSSLSLALTEAFAADKLNVAALGNVVAQLHIHHIVRYRDDLAWPGPVWGRFEAKPYTPEGMDEVIARLKEHLQSNFDYFT